MKFIEVQDGLSINISSITSFERVGKDKTKIFVEGEASGFTVNVPYENLKIFLSRSVGRGVEDNLEQIAKFQTHFGG